MRFCTRFSGLGANEVREVTQQRIDQNGSRAVCLSTITSTGNHTTRTYSRPSRRRRMYLPDRSLVMKFVAAVKTNLRRRGPPVYVFVLFLQKYSVNLYVIAANGSQATIITWAKTSR